MVALSGMGGAVSAQSPSAPTVSAMPGMEPLKVVTATTVFADIIGNTGGERVDAGLHPRAGW